MSEQEIPLLWRDYLFLTQEMNHFLSRYEWAMFYDLMEQRQQLQAKIEQSPDRRFCTLEASRDFVREVKKANDEMHRTMQFVLNSRRRRDNAEKAYGAISPLAAGSQLNRQG